MTARNTHYKFPPVAPLHVNAGAGSDEKPHDLTPDCWCGPRVVRSKDCGTVVNHSGAMRESTASGLAADSRFNGLLAPPSPVAGWIDRRLA